MRLHFRLSPSRCPVPFNYPHQLTGAFHKWLGQNDLHDEMSLYSLGWLQGGRARAGALDFRNGATWFLSAPDTGDGNALIERIAERSLQSPKVCWGMEVENVRTERTPDFGTCQTFRADSPVFVRGRREDENDPHILYDDPRADAYLTRILCQKLEKAGLGHLSDGLSVGFDRTFKTPKTRLIHIKSDFYRRCSVCPVVVSGDAEAVRFAWNVGAGSSTGMGFGSLKL